MYEALVRAFNAGDVLFGLDQDLTAAKKALDDAYGDVATFLNGFSREGRALNRKARAYKKTDIVLQKDLTNAVAAPGVLRERIKEGNALVRQGRMTKVQKLMGETRIGQSGKPARSAFDQRRFDEKLKHEGDRGMAFNAFLEDHQKFDPRLMGGRLGADDTYAPLTSNPSDQWWIAQKTRWECVNYLTKQLDENGAVLHLRGAPARAANPKGQNKLLVETHFDQIDWTKYPDMMDWMSEQNLAGVENYKIWKRTSKAGLEFQTCVQGRSVHFVIDGFLLGDGMARAADKGGKYGKSITAGELRWVYRNWSKPKVKGNVKFWTQGGPHVPPWEHHSYRAMWAAYKPKSGEGATGNGDSVRKALEAF